MHYVGFVDTEDMNVTSGKRKYTSLVGYTGSKLAQVCLELIFDTFDCIILETVIFISGSN